MVTKTADDLRALVQKMLVAAGADDQTAFAVSDHLVQSNLAGVETHGVNQLWRYLLDIRNGQIVPDAQPAVLKQTANSALVSGNWTFGHAVAKFGMELGIEKAKAGDIAIISMVQLHHIGRVGTYGEMAAREGMVGMTFGAGYCQTAKRTAPYGGRGRVLDTNPISMGFPNPQESDDRPVLLDYATTTKAHSAVYLAKRRGQDLPPGLVIDKDGNPSTDPNAFYDDGSLLPFGLHKGYCLMMAVEFLGRIISGSDEYIDPNRGDMLFRHQGVTMIVFKADLFRSMPDYNKSAFDMAQWTRSIDPAPGFDQVMMPGDPEATRRAEYLRDGIPIADDVWKTIVDEAKTLGVDV